MLQNGLCLVSLDTFGHHIIDVLDDSRSELEIILTLNSLLGHRLCNTLRVTTFELPGKKITKPTLEQRNDTADEKDPNAPSWCPEADTGAFTDLTSIEAIVNQVLDVFCHTHLSHEPVLVTIHASQMTDVREDVLKSIC